MGKPSTDFEVVPVGTIRELAFLRHIYNEINFYDGALVYAVKVQYENETGMEVPETYNKD